MYERRSFSVGSFQVWNWSAEKAGTPVRMTWPVVGSVTVRERVGTGTEAPVSRVVSMMKPGERSWMSEGHMFFRSALVKPARRGDSSTIVGREQVESLDVPQRQRVRRCVREREDDALTRGLVHVVKADQELLGGLRRL